MLHFLVYKSVCLTYHEWPLSLLRLKQTEFDFNQCMNHEGVIKGIENITYSKGWTVTGDALHYICTNLFSTSPSNAKKILFVINACCTGSHHETGNNVLHKLS